MTSFVLQDQLDHFRRATDLTRENAEPFFDALIAETDEAMIAAVLRAWEAKGTTENEIYELAKIMRNRAVKVDSSHRTFVDAVGTGGSRAKTFNVSTAAAFVIAGAGVPVAKHGNRAATSNSGSADVLSALGVNPSVDAAKAADCLDRIGICFMFAPNFHRLSPNLAKVRRELGLPTIFNNLGPLCNPARAPHQLIGVWNEGLVAKTARVLARLGTERSWIVHGSDGLDEVTLNGTTFIAEIDNGTVTSFELSPEDFGLESSTLDSLRRSSPEESAKLIISILDGSCQERSAVDLVLINAAVPIFLAGKAQNLTAACGEARKSLTSGAAHEKLQQMMTATNN